MKRKQAKWRPETQREFEARLRRNRETAAALAELHRGAWDRERKSKREGEG